MRDNLKVLRALLSQSVQAVLLTGRTNRVYFSGADIDEGVMLVSRERFWYFTDSRYLEAAQRAMPNCEVGACDRAHPYRMLVAQALAEEKIERVGVEQDVMTLAEYTRYRDAIGAEMVFFQEQLDACRVVKQDWELTHMAEAQRITDLAFTKICEKIRPGMTERELYGQLICTLYENGAQGLAFDPIVVSGPNTSMPHGKPGGRRLEKGDFITMDFGARAAGYCSDMTRTVALGSASEKMREVYQVVLEAQTRAIAAVKAGMQGCQIDAVARKIITDAGYGDCFGHGFGHCLGLEIHETPSCSPACRQILPAGSVTSAEPGIYLPGQFGVRIEDMLIVQENGCLDLTKSPKELIIL